MSYSAFHTLRGDGYDAMMLDTDGSELYETEYEELLGEMVKANDEWMRGISLMGIACRFAQLDTVCFLLDSQPPLGTVEPGDGWCETALLSAATSFSEVGLDWERCQFPERSWVRDRMARSEGLIHLLLDRGASARDVTLSRSHKEDPPQASETVLGWAIAQAS
ncbi:hypothetical protein RU639_001796 [Aspergillus parasiticus]